MNDSDETPSIKMRTRKYPILATGLALLDEYLLGGFRKDSLVHLYGETGAGKTTFAMQVMAHIMREGWKGLWVDCNGAFSLEKFGNILQDRDLLKSIILVQPKSFPHQTQVLQYLKFHLDRVGIIVVDPITHFYRAERFQEASQGYFQELVDTQLGTLIGIAHTQKILVVVVNYATRTPENYPTPLVGQGFARVEHYRLYFKPLHSEDEYGRKCLTIELAPEKYSQNRAFSFAVSQDGITAFQVLRQSELESKAEA